MNIVCCIGEIHCASKSLSNISVDMNVTVVDYDDMQINVAMYTN